MFRLLKIFEKEEGITSIEYALIAALVAMAIVGGATLLGTTVKTNYDNVGAIVTDAIN